MKTEKSLPESIARAMDLSETTLLPFLPYILQDFWEMGSQPETMVRLVDHHRPHQGQLKVLDLGCGKGAVSVKLARQVGCFCHGIDGVQEFIAVAQTKAREFAVDHLCHFEVADARVKAPLLSGFDVVILGAIGPVFGNYFETLSSISSCLKPDGIIVMDDGYLNEAHPVQIPPLLKKGEMLAQVTQAGMQLIDEITSAEEEGLFESYNSDIQHIEKRCLELIDRHPEQTALFQQYLQNQRDEYQKLSTDIIGSTMVFKRINQSSQ